ncbi:MAG: hypothetical protein AAGC92_04325 [Pseudomonadota bacterium]
MTWSSPRMPFAMANARAPLAPPEGKPIIANIAINIEHQPFDRPMPRGVLPPPHGAAPAPPDVPNWAWVEYGMRAGMPRIMAMLEDRGLRASALLNASVADMYPSLMEAILKARWELVGHGWIQQSLKQAEDEEAVIVATLDRLRQMGPVRAWLGPGLGETDATPDLLRKHGILFLHDWYVEDLPVWMRTRHGAMLAMPYAFALNDVPMFVIEQAGSEEWTRRVAATLSVFAREAAQQPRVLTLALHPHVIGVPHLAHRLVETLDLLMARDDVIFMTSSEIGDWYMAADAPGQAAMEAFSAAPPGQPA